MPGLAWGTCPARDVTGGDVARRGGGGRLGDDARPETVLTLVQTEEALGRVLLA